MAQCHILILRALFSWPGTCLESPRKTAHRLFSFDIECVPITTEIRNLARKYAAIAWCIPGNLIFDFFNSFNVICSLKNRFLDVETLKIAGTLCIQFCSVSNKPCPVNVWQKFYFWETFKEHSLYSPSVSWNNFNMIHLCQIPREYERHIDLTRAQSLYLWRYW